MTEPENNQRLTLTPEEVKVRRRRSIALGIVVGLFAVLFYLVTLAKLGSGVFNRPM